MLSLFRPVEFPLGQLGKAKSCYVSLSQFRTGYVRLRKVRSVYFRLIRIFQVK
jgi:hypothetical protein